MWLTLNDVSSVYRQDNWRIKILKAKREQAKISGDIQQVLFYIREVANCVCEEGEWGDIAGMQISGSNTDMHRHHRLDVADSGAGQVLQRRPEDESAQLNDIKVPEA